VPRAVDLQLLGFAVLVGGLVAGAVLRARRRPPGPVALVGAWLLALFGDRLLLDLMVQDLSTSVGAAVLAGLVALAASRGVMRLHGSRGEPSPVALALVAGSGCGVWLAVPETSVVLVVAGVAVGAVAVGTASGHWPPALTTVALIWGLAVAIAIGAESDPHALVGGLVCLSTFVVLGCVPRAPGSVRPADGLIAVLLHLAAALVAARQVGVSSSWGMALLAGPAVVVLAVLAGGMLRPRQRS